MKAVFSFWSLPAIRWTESVYKTKGGFYNRYYLEQSWILSVNLAKKWFEKVELITDTVWKEWLVDKLGLEFDSVIIAFDWLENTVHHECRSYGKLIAYSLQNEPFIHIDYDMYLEKPLPEDVINSPICGQFYENAWWDLYQTCLKYIDKNQGVFKFPKELTHYMVWDMKKSRALNMWFFGWHNIDLIHKYTEVAMKFIADNKEVLFEQPDARISDWNVFNEQYIGTAVFNYYWVRPKTLHYTCYTHFDWFHHLLGSTKGTEEAGKRIESKAKDLILK